MDTNEPIKDESAEEDPDREVIELMENHDLDKDTAEGVQEIMDDLGVDEDDAVELE
jgi:chorismate mutase